MAEHSQIATNTGTMNKDISELRNALQSARNQLKKMYEEVVALSATWEGPTHNEFLKQMEEDKAYCEDFFKMIDSSINSMEKSKKAYDDCDRQVGEIIASM